MTVQELINELQLLDPDSDVILSSDPEGNDFLLLSDFTVGAYIEDGYYLDVGIYELTDELRQQGYEEGDVVENGKPAVILWP
jgi:hypothetical protein